MGLPSTHTAVLPEDTVSNSAPRLPLLSLEESRAAAEEVGVPAPFAELSIFRVLLAHPPLAKQVASLLVTLLFGSKLDARLRELVIMRLGWATASVYEWTQHWRVALELGVSEEDVLAVRDWRSHEGFGPAERAVLAATDEVLEHGAVTRETWELCEQQLGSPQELLELVAAIGWWRMISSLLRSLEIPLEDGTAPWPPDGAKPAHA